MVGCEKKPDIGRESRKGKSQRAVASISGMSKSTIVAVWKDVKYPLLCFC